MATAYYHACDSKSNFTPAARACIAGMIAQGLRQHLHDNCIFTVDEPDACGWRMVHVDSVDGLLAAASSLKAEG